MNVSFGLMLKIFLIQCLLTMIFAIPFHIGGGDSSSKVTVSSINH